jgi:hypothetical protein
MIDDDDLFDQPAPTPPAGQNKAKVNMAKNMAQSIGPTSSTSMASDGAPLSARDKRAARKAGAAQKSVRDMGRTVVNPSDTPSMASNYGGALDFNKRDNDY